MAVLIDVHLFGKPSWHLDDGEPVTGTQINEVGNGIQQWLLKVGAAVDRLTAAGWETEMSLYSVNLLHEAVHTEAEAEAAITALGLDVSMFSIVDLDDDEEDEQGGDGEDEHTELGGEA